MRPYSAICSANVIGLAILALLWAISQADCVMGDEDDAIIDIGFSDMRCAQAFSFQKYEAKFIDGASCMGALLAIRPSRDEKIKVLYEGYYRASLEGKAFILWGLYALDAKEYVNLKKEFLGRAGLKMNRIEPGKIYKQTCQEFIIELEGKSKTARLQEIDALIATMNGSAEKKLNGEQDAPSNGG